MQSDSFDIFDFRRDPNPTRSGQGVYFLFREYELLYIGKSVKCTRRVSKHKWFGRIPFEDWRVIPVDDEEDCGQLERAMIRKFKPPYNG